MGHIHSDSECDFTVSATIIHDGKVLLLLHHKLHKWLFPGGHIELYETPLQACYRETEEETGLAEGQLELVKPYTDNLHFERPSHESSTEPMPFDIDIHTVTAGGHRHIDMGYMFKSNTNETTAEVGGAETLRWMTLGEMDELANLPRLIHARSYYALNLMKGTR